MLFFFQDYGSIVLPHSLERSIIVAHSKEVGFAVSKVFSLFMLL
jgi:hypothetical protein